MPAKMKKELIEEAEELEAAGFQREEIAKELGVSTNTLTRHLGIKCPKRKYVFVDDEMLKKMTELREKGLSNSQIDIELGLSKGLTRKHIGKQKMGVRAEYGSIVAHTSGESYIPKEEKKMKAVVSEVSFKGSEFSYTVSNKYYNEIVIFAPDGKNTHLDLDKLNNFIKELQEVRDWIQKNGDVVLLDGKPKSQEKHLLL